MSFEEGFIKEEINKLTNQYINDEHPNAEIFDPHAISCSLYDEEEAKKIDDSFLFPVVLNIEKAALCPSNKDKFGPDDVPATDLIELSTNQQNTLDDQDHEYNNKRIHLPLDIQELVDSTQTGHPEGDEEKCSEKEWHRVSFTAKDGFYLEYCIRNEPRTTLHELGKGEEEIKLDCLKQMHNNVTYGEQYWFHATSRKKALNFILFGPNFSRKLADFSVNGAFYLNPSYIDGYEWCIKNNSNFNGDHVILIYKFDPEKISKKGEELTKQQWERLIFKRNKKSRKSEPHWSYVFQSANPWEKACNQRQRWTKDGERAMQLVIRSKKMCKKLRPCLVGCVYYQNDTIGGIPDQHQFCSNNDNIMNMKEEEEQDEKDSSDERNVNSTDTFQMAEHHSKSSYKPKERRNGRGESKRNISSLRKSKHKEFNQKDLRSYID